MAYCAPHILAISSFKKAGVWRDFSSPAHLRFKTRSLVYGFNGTGKTTLTRVFSSIQTGVTDPRLPSTSEFSVEFSDGTSINNLQLESLHSNNILVFNVDFVAENLLWEDGETVGIAYISAGSIQDKEELKKVSSEISSLVSDLSVLESSHEVLDEEIHSFAQDVAAKHRELRKGTMYTQQYNAGHVKRRYGKFVYGENHLLTPVELAAKHELLQQSEPPEQVQFTSYVPNEYLDWLKQGERLLSFDFSQHFVGEHPDYPGAVKWLQDGYNMHLENDLGSCLFCANPLSEERLAILGSIFTSMWRDAISEIGDAIEMGERLQTILRNYYRSVPKDSILSSDFKQSFNDARRSFLKSVGLLGAHGEELINQLKSLIKEPTQSKEYSQNTTFPSHEEWLADFEIAQNALHQIIGEHNESAGRHEDLQNEALIEIEEHLLAEHQAQWTRFNEQKKRLSGELDNARSEKIRLEHQKSDLVASLNDNAAAAKSLNHMITCYLGHSEIYLESSSGGFRIRRSSGEYASYLSEGERTAIAFCYFLTKINEIGRSKENQILIIDDPVTSLDTNVRSIAFSFMKRMTEGCAQVIVLTHNASFMNMVKGGYNLKRKTKNESLEAETRDDNKHAMFFLDCQYSPDNGTRSTKLIPMPPLLAKYSSEYNYLFQVVFEAATKDRSEFLYFLPNAIRKLLDIFFGFTAPGNSKFSKAIKSLNVQEESDIEIDALERFVQIESHAEIDGVKDLPDFTLEFATRAARQAMGLIRHVSKEHYERMIELCGDSEN